MRAHDQSSIFSTGGKFRPDYGLLLELHALTLVARSYALLLQVTVVHASQQKVLPLIVRKDKDLASWAEIGRPRTGCRNLTHSS